MKEVWIVMANIQINIISTDEAKNGISQIITKKAMLLIVIDSYNQ